MAMKTDKGHLLVEALITEMRKRKIILPAIYAVKHVAWAVRERAVSVFSMLKKNPFGFFFLLNSSKQINASLSIFIDYEKNGMSIDMSFLLFISKRKSSMKYLGFILL